MPVFSFPPSEDRKNDDNSQTYLPSLINDVWQTFYHSKQVHWIDWPCFIRQDVDIILTCPGIDKIIPCHFRVLRELIPFFFDFGNFGCEDSIPGLDENRHRKTSNFIVSPNRFHSHNPFRPPSHVAFTELQTESEGKALIDVITSCYSNAIEINDDNVVDVYTVANLLHMKHLCKDCTNVMSKNIDLSNAVKYWRVADGNESVCSSVVDDLYDITKLSRDMCVQQFGKLNVDQTTNLNLEQMKYLLAQEDLGVESEDQIFVKVISWLEMQYKTHVPERPDIVHNMALNLIPQVRLPQCSFQNLVRYEKFAQKLEFNHTEERKLMKLVGVLSKILNFSKF